MAIKIAISLTALSLIQIGMAEVWDRKGSAPNVGQDRQAHYLFIPHHCRITARWVGRGVVARLVWWAVVLYHERAQYKAETLYRVETRCFSETFCLFLPYLFKPRPSLFVELGAFVYQRETSARFCHQRNLQAFFVTFCLFAFWRN